MFSSSFLRKTGRPVLLLAAILLLAGCALTPAATPAPAASPAAGGGLWEAVDAADATATAAAASGGAAPTLVATKVVETAPTVTAPQVKATRTKAPTAAPQVKATRTKAPTRTPEVKASATPRDGLATIREQDLPKEARTTLRLIRAGGPFPYDKDGSVFQNREGRLPKKPRGYYREYTVITPGENDRGARRIIGGENGELYYTDDHYDSFKRVTP